MSKISSNDSKRTAQRTKEENNALDQIRDDIIQLNKSVQSLLNGPLNERALLILIRDATPPIGAKYNKKKVSIKTVRAVLNGIAAMEEEFLS